MTPDTLSQQQLPVPPPGLIVIFGATGDLAKRKLLPALYNLFKKERLPRGFAILGVSRKEMTVEAFRSSLKRALTDHALESDESSIIRKSAVYPGPLESANQPKSSDPQGHREEETKEVFLSRVFCTAVEYDRPETFQNLKAKVKDLEKQKPFAEVPEGGRLFYLAVPPEAYIPIADGLKRAGLHIPPDPKTEPKKWARIIVEKPIGYDLESARDMNNGIGRVFKEEQIYRIDHYLGKEAVQNLLVFRFANGIFEPVWNRNYIDHVQITAAETVGVEGRGRYYEKSGALRDMVQNHLLQVLAHMAMEPPSRFDPHTFRNERVKVFDSINPFEPDSINETVVRAQYGPGKDPATGTGVPGYRDEPGVDPASMTETYAALKIEIDNWRWAGVPFYLRTGKRLAKRVSEVTLVFKEAPHQIFQSPGDLKIEDDEYSSSFSSICETSHGNYGQSAGQGGMPEANVLSIRLQPDEGISLRFGAKVPGQGMRVKPVTMKFDYRSAFNTVLTDAYERLLLDALLGDASLFARRDGVEAGWKILMPVLEAWDAQNKKTATGKSENQSAGARSFSSGLPTYPAGSWGPEEAVQLLRRDGCWWRECL